jgi:hypothetical protein
VRRSRHRDTVGREALDPSASQKGGDATDTPG